MTDSEKTRYDYSDVLDLYASDRQFPCDVREGRTIFPAAGPSVNQNNKSSGDLPFQLTQTDPVEADQSLAVENSFLNLIYANFATVNDSDEELVLKVKGEYKDSTDSWIEVPSQIGEKKASYDYKMEESSTFTVPARQQKQFAFCVKIPVNSPQWEIKRRAHMSLPQPLNIRFTFEDQKARKCEVLVEQSNPLLNIVDWDMRSNQLAEQGMRMTNYFYADDRDMEIRISAEWYYPRNDSYDCAAVQFRVANRQPFVLDKEYLKKLVLKAREEKVNSIAIPDAEWNEKGCSFSAELLIDEKGIGYGIKTLVQTTTNKSTGFCMLPLSANC